MKKLIMLFIVLICAGSLNAHAQYQYLKIENTQLIFEKIYIVDSLKSFEIEKILLETPFKDVYTKSSIFEDFFILNNISFLLYIRQN